MENEANFLQCPRCDRRGDLMARHLMLMRDKNRELSEALTFQVNRNWQLVYGSRSSRLKIRLLYWKQRFGNWLLKGCMVLALGLFPLHGGASMERGAGELPFFAENADRMDYDGIMAAWLASSLGVPYYYGGNNKIQGFDCSGFIMEYLRMFGIGPKIDSSSDMIYEWFVERPAMISHYKPGKGTLIFYGKTSSDRKRITEISHIGLMINPYQVAEAGGGNRATLSEERAAAQNAFVRIRPYTYRTDIVFMLNPALPEWTAFQDEIRPGTRENCSGSVCNEATYANYQLPWYF